MNLRIVIQTFAVRAMLLVFNLGLLVLSAHLWGSAGRGSIALLMADLAIISFFSNIFTGSSVSYFASRTTTTTVLVSSYFWALLVGFTVPFTFALARGTSENLFWLVSISIFMALFNANVNLFVGHGKVERQNRYFLLQMGVHLVFLLLFVFLLGEKNVSVYFLGLLLSFALLFFLSGIEIYKTGSVSASYFTKTALRDMFIYGWKNQLSVFIQFLNYRLSFYFLEFFRGIASVGIFSVGAAVSEAIWTFSRSISTVLYADIVNDHNGHQATQNTKNSLRITFYFSVVFMLLLLLIPSEIYVFVFGRDFAQTSRLLLLLSPGVLAVAVSNNIGYYFAGVNKLKILNVKSVVGLLVVIPTSLLLIPEFGVEGACIAASLSYCASSGVLFWKFYTVVTPFRFSDFKVSRAEFGKLLRMPRSASSK